MKYNGLASPVGRVAQGNPCTFYVQGDSLSAIAEAMDGGITATHAGEVVGVWPDYRVTCVRWEREGLAAVTAERSIDPDTKGAIERLEQAQRTLSQGQAAQEGVNTETAERLDEQDVALAELAGIIAGEE